VERAQQQEAYYDQLMTSHQSEVTALKNQVVSLKRDLDTIKTRYNETSEKLMEKTRQYQKLQVRDLIKRL
jgi:predicted  nucleic acid-binding Zn-ribbon protein